MEGNDRDAEKERDTVDMKRTKQTVRADGGKQDDHGGKNMYDLPCSRIDPLPREMEEPQDNRGDDVKEGRIVE